MCACSTPTCDDNAVAVVFLRLPASAHSHVHKGNVTAAFLQGRDTELERGPLATRVQELSETLKLQPWSVCNLGRPCTRVRTCQRAASMVREGQSGDGSSRLDCLLSGTRPLESHEQTRTNLGALLCSRRRVFLGSHLTRARVKLDRTVTHWNNSSSGHHGKTVTFICGVHCIIVKTLCTTGGVRSAWISMIMLM